VLSYLWVLGGSSGATTFATLTATVHTAVPGLRPTRKTALDPFVAWTATWQDPALASCGSIVPGRPPAVLNAMSPASGTRPASPQ